MYKATQLLSDCPIKRLRRGHVIFVAVKCKYQHGSCTAFRVGMRVVMTHFSSVKMTFRSHLFVFEQLQLFQTNMSIVF